MGDNRLKTLFAEEAKAKPAVRGKKERTKRPCPKCGITFAVQGLPNHERSCDSEKKVLVETLPLPGIGLDVRHAGDGFDLSFTIRPGADVAGARSSVEEVRRVLDVIIGFLEAAA